MWRMVAVNLLPWRQRRADQRLRWALLIIALQACAIIINKTLFSPTLIASQPAATLLTQRSTHFHQQPQRSLPSMNQLLIALKLLAQQLPNTLYLSSLSWQSPNWQLTGYGYHYPDILHFHHQLQNTAVFSAISLDKIQRQPQRWQFTLQMHQQAGRK